VQSAILHYPRDLRQARSLLHEAGWTNREDGTQEKNGEPFSLTMRDADGEQDPLILASQWKEIGVSATYEPRSTALLRDRQDRATFTGVDITANPMAILSVTRRLATVGIPATENRWTGSNRGGYSNQGWDELDRRVNGALRQQERVDIEREMLRIFTADLPLLPLFFRFDLVPVGAGIKGPMPNTGTSHRGFILHTWNVAEWDLPSAG
jgi:peptide/nickel transport system substrate-binding protein